MKGTGRTIWISLVIFTLIAIAASKSSGPAAGVGPGAGPEPNITRRSKSVAGTPRPKGRTGRTMEDVHSEPKVALANPVLVLKPDFCEAQLLSEKFEKEDRQYRRECKKFNPYHLKFFLSLFGIISWGALVRSVLRATNAPVPYTVVLMVTGLLWGLGSRIPKEQWETGCEHWTVYTRIARMPPQIILYVFLPTLLFESAFSMNPHVFYRSAAQILVAALPGMLITTFVTALVCQYFLKTYSWDFNQASLFGSIISATDPVAVVAILKELGTSEALSTMIEGESLLNDGVAILMYEIFEHIVVEPHAEGLALTIVRKFCQITLGGPVFGFFMAKVAIACVSVIFNDATVEITVTLVAAYLTYYVGEAILGVSGVMAVVVLGIVMSSEKTSISPEVETLVHHFWEMLGYLANTVLFVIVGVVISETAINAFQWTDLAYLLFLYMALNIIRLFMLLVLSPLLSRLGYGMTWQSMIVMMWGGLRGAVSICLSLEIYSNAELCDNRNIGPKFLLQTAGIVFLTLVVNGTTTQALLDCLGVTEISIGRIQDMSNAHKQICGAQARTMAVLKSDRFLADAKWELVERYTSIENPYAKQKTKNKVKAPTDSTSILSLDKYRVDRTTVCEECDHVMVNEPSKEEYREMTEEARLRCLKALKVSFWRQYEQGVLTDLAVQILRNAASAAEDKPLCIIHSRDLNKYWVLHGWFPWLQIQLTKRFGKEEALPEKPSDDCRRCCWYIATSDWFEYFIMAVVVLNVIPAIWETYDIANKDEKDISSNEVWTFFGVNFLFLIIYVCEAIIKILGRGANDYFCVDYWNYLDILLLVASFADITIALITNLKLISINSNSIKILKFVRVTRVLRAVRLLRPLFPAMMKILDGRINEQLFLGYDVGKGFVTAVDDVIKFLPQMIAHPKILKKLRNALEHERLQTVREMGMLQKGHPGIAIAVKTRHASRTVLNQMRETLLELKEDGLIDEKEYGLLVTSLEEKMKRLWHSPPTIPSFAPETLLENLSWVYGNDQILDFVKENAELITFSFGDIMSAAGETPNGIFIVVSGMVKIHYIPIPDVIKVYEEDGIVPNMELFLDLTFRHEELDFFSTGTIIGEKSVLTGEPRSATVSCETVVIAYHLPQDLMKQALALFTDPFDSLESRMWRSFGIRLATALLPTQPAYASWTLDKIRMHLERSAVPIGEKFETMTVPEYISDIVVIHGQVRNYHTQEVYQAPSLVPRACSKFAPVDGAPVPPRILVIAHEEIDHEAETGPESTTSSLHSVVVKQSGMDVERAERFSRSRMNESISKSLKLEVSRRKSLGKRVSKSKPERKLTKKKDPKV